MNKQTEHSLRMALDKWVNNFAHERHQNNAETRFWLAQYKMAFNDLFNTCKQALEQSYLAVTNEDNLAIKQEKVTEREQPAQEPVAFIEIIEHDGYKTSQCNFYANGLTLANGTELYTHPAQSWQGLTEDEIDILEHNDFTCWNRDDLIVFGRAIEQELKTKNGFSDIQEKNHGN